MRHVQDTKAITSKINKDADIVVIGTSFIGMEVAAAIQKKEPKSVTLVGVDKVPFAAILGEEIGNAIMQVSSCKSSSWLTVEYEAAGHQVYHGGRDYRYQAVVFGFVGMWQCFHQGPR